MRGKTLQNIRPTFQERIVTRNQSAADIVRSLKKQTRKSSEDANKLSRTLAGSNDLDSCERIFDFIKDFVAYRKEPGEKQTAATLARTLHQGFGDCKHYSVMAAALCRSLGIPCQFRLISQNYYDPQPTHIYVVARDRRTGEQIIIDPVLNSFNEEAGYRYNYDINI